MTMDALRKERAPRPDQVFGEQRLFPLPRPVGHLSAYDTPYSVSGGIIHQTEEAIRVYDLVWRGGFPGEVVGVDREEIVRPAGCCRGMNVLVQRIGARIAAVDAEVLNATVLESACNQIPNSGDRAPVPRRVLPSQVVDDLSQHVFRPVHRVDRWKTLQLDQAEPIPKRPRVEDIRSTKTIRGPGDDMS